MLDDSMNELMTEQEETHPQLAKDSSDCSNFSLNSYQHENRNISFRWLFSTTLKISRDTQYLALAYLDRLPYYFFALERGNYECLAASALLIACKFNEVTAPKVSFLAENSKCTVQDIIMVEYDILEALKYCTAITFTPYTLIYWLLKDTHESQLERCQKLLRIAMQHQELMNWGEDFLAKAVALVILPHFMQEQLCPRILNTVAILAMKVYSRYRQAKSKHETHKKSRKP